MAERLAHPQLARGDLLFRPTAEDIELLQASHYFNADWYRATYPDTDMIGMDPCLHFLRYGRLLRRDPGPEFQTGFYLDTYTDADAGNPLLQHLRAGDRERRFVTRAALLSHMRDLAEQTSTAWNTEAISSASARTISYCTPVMGRLDDLKETLYWNLQENSEFRDRVEFLIVAFGPDTEVQDWVADNMPDALSDGYLRVVTCTDTLDSWHFGKAKNAFRPYVHGRIYSSLDADNFVTADETRVLFDLSAAYPEGFVFHHFSGNWGDGTSGRVSMPVSLYRHVGYDDRAMPRQYDEIDVILGTMTEFPALTFIGVNEERHIFRISGSARNYFHDEKLPNRRCFIGPVADHRPPLNPRGEHYVQEDRHFREMGNFNAALSAYKRSKSHELAKKYRQRLQSYKHRLIEALPADKILSDLFRIEPMPTMDPITPDSVCAIACVHNEEDFLPSFVNHHRELGVTHFLFVDDNSTRPVRDVDLGENVLSLRPKIGDFRTCKTLWMEGIVKALVPQGTWLCILDADEMLHLPKPFSSLRDLTGHLATQDRDFATCLLLDMLPDLRVPLDQLDIAEADVASAFGWFCDVPTPASKSYCEHGSIAWGFGPHADLSWRFDARFHAFGTFDSLRKLSVCRHAPGRHLNQGFHTFHFTDKTEQIGHEIWHQGPILPVFHYKLVKLFSDSQRTRMLKQADGYHARTQQNISSIFGDGHEGAIAKMANLAKYLRPATDALQAEFFSRDTSSA